jgi:hypothetical protein
MSKISAPYLIRKRGILYLQKRVPKQLIGRYGKHLIRKSLRTAEKTLLLKGIWQSQQVGFLASLKETTTGSPNTTTIICG